MKNITQFPRVSPVASQGVISLNCRLQMHFDPVPLQRLFAQKDLRTAEEVVCRMLEDIALRLEMLQHSLGARDYVRMQKPARRIGLVSKELGLVEVANAAGHVRACLSIADGVAVEATMSRLERGFDAAVSEVWNFRDL